MILREVGFRPVYRNVCAFVLNDQMRTKISSYREADLSSYALVLGTIDREEGLLLEFLGGGTATQKKFSVLSPYEGGDIFWTAEELADVEFFPLPHTDPWLQQYTRMKVLQEHQTADYDEALEKCRSYESLDGCRILQYPDILRAWLVRDGQAVEELWVELQAPEANGVRGRVLHKPHTACGLKQGSIVSLSLQQSTDGQTVCVFHLDDKPQTEAAENPLLDLSRETGIEPLLCENPDAITKRLLGGGEFVLLPNPKSGETEEKGTAKGRIYTGSSSPLMQQKMTMISRLSREKAGEESFSLYLAIGVLRWYETSEEETPCYAPLVLLPVRVYQKQQDRSFYLRGTGEMPRFNEILQAMLEEELGVSLLGTELLQDPGVKVKQFLEFVGRQVNSAAGRISDGRGWEIMKICLLGNFDLAAYDIRKDIETFGSSLKEGKLARSLEKGRIDWKVSEEKTYEGETIYLPEAEDALQRRAMKMASAGETFLLLGASGTGKSRAIGGIIADMMAKGKRVLMVSNQQAALDEVWNFLERQGLGDFCRKIDPDGNVKEQMAEKMHPALLRKNTDSRNNYQLFVREEEDLCRKLEEYAGHLHAVQNCGCSLQELLEMNEGMLSEKQAITFEPETAGQLTDEQISRHEECIRRLVAAGETIGLVFREQLRSGENPESGKQPPSLRQTADQYLKDLTSLQDLSERSAKILGEACPKTRTDQKRLYDLVRIYKERKNTPQVMIDYLATDTYSVYSYFEQLGELEQKKAYLLKYWKEDFLSRNMDELQKQWEDAPRKVFGRNAAMDALEEEIAEYTSMTVTYEDIPRLLKPVINYQKACRQLEKNMRELPESGKKVIRKLHSREEFQKLDAESYVCRKQIEKFPGGIKAILAITEDLEESRTLLACERLMREAFEEEQNLNAWMMRRTGEAADDWIRGEIAYAENLKERLADPRAQELYKRRKQECADSGLIPVIEAFEQGMSGNLLMKAYKKGFYHALITDIFRRDPLLADFSGEAFESQVRRLKKVNEILQEQTRQEMYRLLAMQTAEGRDFPCRMMSLPAAAKNLPQKAGLYDLVILDLASGLGISQVLGVLARGKNVILAGDPSLEKEKEDSILQAAMDLNLPEVRLKRNYRSRHESLFTFSNKEWYKNSIQTIPSAEGEYDAVRLVRVNGRCRNQSNRKEAEMIVGEIVRRYNHPLLKGESIGVITFGRQQQMLIEDLLEQQYRLDPYLAAWAEGKNPLWVKTAGQAAGEERDAILLSVTLGPDDADELVKELEMLQKAGGEKLLHAAITRARESVTVFASISAADIPPEGEIPAVGQELKKFLQYAGKGNRSECRETKDGKWTGGNPIPMSIKAALESFGYSCRMGCGNSDFCIDLAVEDPKAKEHYLLGILLDSENGRKGENILDREVFLTDDLEKRGWTITRVRTIDWWKDRDREIYRLRQLLRQQQEKNEREV